MACTTKSILPQCFSSVEKTSSMVASSLTSQWPARKPSISANSGSTRFFSASP
ncbi:hypothetical protein D3C72_2423720 [compost metagenome]